MLRPAPDSPAVVDGRRVGTYRYDAQGEVYLDKGKLDPIKHKFRNPPGWGTDVELLEPLGLSGYVRFQTPDRTDWRATGEMFQEHGRRWEWGESVQVILPDKWWRQTNPQQPQLVVPAATPSVACSEEVSRMTVSAVYAPTPIAPTAQPIGASPVGADAAVVSFGVLTITPATAARWLEQYRYRHQRTARLSQVRKLARAIGLGEFEPTTITFGNLHGVLSLVDGQHRLLAIVESGQPVDLNVMAKRVASDEELAHLYASLDCPVVRTFMDGYDAYGLQDELGLTQRRHVGMLSAAVVYIINGFRAHVGDDAALRGVRLHMMRDWADEAREAFTILAGALDARRMGSAGVLSVMLVTLRYAPDRAPDFWRRVAHGVELVKGMPELALHTYVRTHQAGGSNRPPVYARAVAAAWNAYISGRPLQIVRAGDVAAPIVIKGTPYNGKQDAA